MTKHIDNTTTLWALDVLRRFEPAPLAVEDYHVAIFRRQCERDAALRAVMEPVQPRVYDDEQRDAGEFFASEMCPSDATFR